MKRLLLALIGLIGCGEVAAPSLPDAAPPPAVDAALPLCSELCDVNQRITCDRDEPTRCVCITADGPQDCYRPWP